MRGTSRPAWGCLDAGEIQRAAAGHADDSAVRAHLEGCGSCRQEVRELRGALGRTGRTGQGSGYRRPLLKRPAFWLLPVVLVGLGVGYVVLTRKQLSPPPATERAPAAEAQPAAASPKRPKVRRERPARSSASPSDAQVVNVIRSNQTGVRVCYERALKRDPSLSLRLDASVNITAGGLVERVRLDGLRPGGQLDNCIRKVIRTWKFPAAATGYETAFPLRLEAKF